MAKPRGRGYDHLAEVPRYLGRPQRLLLWLFMTWLQTFMMLWWLWCYLALYTFNIDHFRIWILWCTSFYGWLLYYGYHRTYFCFSSSLLSIFLSVSLHTTHFSLQPFIFHIKIANFQQKCCQNFIKSLFTKLANFIQNK